MMLIAEFHLLPQVPLVGTQGLRVVPVWAHALWKGVISASSKHCFPRRAQHCRKHSRPPGN